MSYIIDRLDDFGRGITNVDGKTCFVYNALDEEEVDIEIINSKKKYLEAEQIKIDKSNTDRVTPKCPYYLECGGCNIMHMNYEKQLKFKEDKIKNTLKKFAGIDNVVRSIIPSEELIYRNKITLKVKNGVLGLYKNKSNNLINIDKCLICSNAINEVIKELNNIKLNNLDEIIIRSNYKNETLISLCGNNIDSDYYINSLKSINNIVIIDKGSKKIIKGKDYIIDKIGNLLFKVSIESFFQINSFEVEKLYNKVLEYANLNGNENILDLYCGTGTIGMFLSKKAKKVFGIEINENAIKDANYNKELNNVKNIEFLCSDVGLIKSNYKDVDLVVIDPPRSGLSNEAIKNVIDINPKKIIYVSCDQITLARDLNILKNNYTIKEVTPVDMFPNTYHVETVSVLYRKTIEK